MRAPQSATTSFDVSTLYLDAYDAAVEEHERVRYQAWFTAPDASHADLRFWGEMLSRHHRSLRRPYATGGLRIRVVDEDQPIGCQLAAIFNPSTALRAGGDGGQAQKKRPAVPGHGSRSERAPKDDRA